jgi:hypothetical protein
MAIFSAQQLPFTVTGQAQFNLMEIIPLRLSNQHLNVSSNTTVCLLLKNGYMFRP